MQLTQFNQLCVSRKGGARVWHGKYRDGKEESVTAQWVEENFKAWFRTHCETRLGKWCYVPVGKNDTSASGLEACTGADPSGAPSVAPVAQPEVRFQSGAGEDFCLAYGAASAVHHLGDLKLSPRLAAKASTIERAERQMQQLRSTADASGWKPTVIKSIEKVAAFDPLTACPDGSALVMHLKETDGSAEHAVAIAASSSTPTTRTRCRSRLG